MGVDQPLICRQFYAGNQHKEQACKSRLGLVSESSVRPQPLAERRPQRRPGTGTGGSQPRRLPRNPPLCCSSITRFSKDGTRTQTKIQVKRIHVGISTPIGLWRAPGRAAAMKCSVLPGADLWTETKPINPVWQDVTQRITPIQTSERLGCFSSEVNLVPGIFNQSTSSNINKPNSSWSVF